LATAAARAQRFAELDLMRGVAALWVVLFHYLRQYDHLYSPSDATTFFANFPDGIFGVYLFFMISGFVIFMTLERSARPLDFVVSRFSRLYPAYWTAVIVTGAVALVAPLPGQSVTSHSILINLSMLQSFFFVPAVDGVYWTLAVELSFYFVMFVLFLGRQLGRIEIWGTIWLALVVAAGLAGAAGWDVPYRVSLLLVLPYAHWFVLGILFYLVRTDGYTRRRILLMLACIATAAFMQGFAVAAVMIGFAVLFHLCVSGRARALAVRPLLWLGAISYPLYLTHQMLGYRLIRTLLDAGCPRALAVVIAIAGALALATAITRTVEQPAMQTIRRWYRRARVPTALAGTTSS
jgi:peptidoglycan/LPS O-acetylase OafA/YrhL